MATVIQELDVGLFIGDVTRRPKPINTRDPFAARRDEIDPAAMPMLNAKNISALFCAGGTHIISNDFETCEAPLPATEIMDSEFRRIIDKLDKAAIILKKMIDEGHNVLIYADNFRLQAAFLAAFYLIKIKKRGADEVIRSLETCLFTAAERAADVQYITDLSRIQAAYKELPDTATIDQTGRDAVFAKKMALDEQMLALEKARNERARKRCLCGNSFKKLLRGVK